MGGRIGGRVDGRTDWWAGGGADRRIGEHMDGRID